jgi:hypothetical protein
MTLSPSLMSRMTLQPAHASLGITGGGGDIGGVRRQTSGDWRGEAGAEGPGGIRRFLYADQVGHYSAPHTRWPGLGQAHLIVFPFSVWFSSTIFQSGFLVWFFLFSGFWCGFLYLAGFQDLKIFKFKNVQFSKSFKFRKYLDVEIVQILKIWRFGNYSTKKMFTFWIYSDFKKIKFWKYSDLKLVQISKMFRFKICSNFENIHFKNLFKFKNVNF